MWIVYWPIYSATGWPFNVIYQLSYWVNYLSSATNPIILLVFNKPIRKNVKTMFCYSPDPPGFLD